MTQEFPIWMQNQDYSARLDRQLVRALFTEGVVEGLAVTQRGAGANMSVDVGVGSAVIAGDDQTNQGSYLVHTTVAENIAIGAAPASNSRIDLVYYRVNDPNAGGPAGDNSVIGVVAGTSSATPVAPALPTSAIPLAHVLVAAGTVAITNAMITSVRTPSLINGQVPPGTCVPFSGPASAIPATWSLADGTELNRGTDFRLFSVIGTTYGSGDGSTTFNKPDLRGRTVMGLDNMGGVDAGRLSSANTLGLGIGSETVALGTANMPAHTHSTPAHVHTASASSDGHSHVMTHGHTGSSGSAGSHTHTGDTNNTGSHFHYATPGGLGLFVVNTPGSGQSVAVSSGPYTAVNYSSTANGGGHEHSYTTDSAGSHGHTITVANYTGSTASDNHAHTITVNNGGAGTSGSAGSGTPFSVLNPAILMNWIIKL